MMLTAIVPQGNVESDLQIQDDRVRLFTVDRDNKGTTVISRIHIDDELLNMIADGWTLSRLWVMGHLGGVPDV